MRPDYIFASDEPSIRPPVIRADGRRTPRRRESECKGSDSGGGHVGREAVASPIPERAASLPKVIPVVPTILAALRTDTRGADHDCRRNRPSARARACRAPLELNAFDHAEMQRLTKLRGIHTLHPRFDADRAVRGVVRRRALGRGGRAAALHSRLAGTLLSGSRSRNFAGAGMRGYWPVS